MAFLLPSYTNPSNTAVPYVNAYCCITNWFIDPSTSSIRIELGIFVNQTAFNNGDASVGRKVYIITTAQQLVDPTETNGSGVPTRAATFLPTYAAFIVASQRQPGDSSTIDGLTLLTRAAYTMMVSFKFFTGATQV